MNKLLKIIKEELIKFLKEELDDIDYNLYEKQDELKSEILSDFLFKNNPEFTKRIYWRVVPAARVKKIWEDYIRMGIVRDEKGINLIESIMIRNALNLHNLTMLSGHTPSSPDEDFEDAWGEYVDDYVLRVLQPQPQVDIDQTEIPFDNPSPPHVRKKAVKQYEIEPYYDNIRNIPFENYVKEHEDDAEMDGVDIKNNLMEILKEHFYFYYSTDSNGNDIMSDFGTDPLVQLAFQLAKESEAEKKVVIIDKMLNVVHQRSDLASWFIEGGSAALSDISGYMSDEKYSWDSKSNISGKYKLSDYS